MVLHDSHGEASELLSPVERVLGELVQAGNLSLNKWLMTPALVLLFSTIDVASGLDPELRLHCRVRDRFEAWVDKYLLPTSRLSCTATDLYGARCGLVHDYSSESNLSSNGRAKEIYYVLHDKEARQIERAIVAADLPNVVVISIEALTDAMALALEAFISDLKSDPARYEKATAWAGERCFVSLREIDGKIVPYPHTVEDLISLKKHIEKKDN